MQKLGFVNESFCSYIFFNISKIDQYIYKALFRECVLNEYRSDLDKPMNFTPQVSTDIGQRQAL